MAIKPTGSPDLYAMDELTARHKAASPAAPGVPSQSSALTHPAHPTRTPALATQLRGEATGKSREAGAASEVATTANTSEVAMREYLHEVFAPFRNEGNAGAMDALAENRCAVMLLRGETPQTLESKFAYAAGVEMYARAMAGASGAIPFAVANAVGSQIFKAIPNPAAAGAVAGLLTAALVYFGGSINEEMTKRTLLLRPDLDKLEPVMKEAMESNKPTEAQVAKETSGAFMLYPLSFLTLGMLGLAGHAVSPEAGNLSKLIANPLTSLAGGAIVGAVQHQIDTNMGRIGAALVLGSTSFEAQLDHLDQRLAMPLEQRTLASAQEATPRTDMLNRLLVGIGKAGHQFTGLSTYASSAVWAGGCAVGGFVSDKMTTAMRAAGRSEVEIAAAQQAVFAGSLIPINLIWGVLLAYGPDIDEKVRTQALKQLHGTDTTEASEEHRVANQV